MNSDPKQSQKVDGMTAILDRPVLTDPSFTVDRAVFATAAAQVARAIPSRPSVPILAGARLAVSGDRLTLSGFDYETSTEVTVACDGAADGTVIVSGALLANIAKSLPSKPVQVSVDGAKATVVCGSARFTLPTMPVDEYPQLPAMPEVAGTVDARVFADAVGAVKNSHGNDDTLPMLTGVHLTFEQDTITLTATDRFRLAITTIPWESTGALPEPVLVPGKFLAEAARGMDAGVVSLAVGDGVLGVQYGSANSTIRLLDAEFPAVRKLLPPGHTSVAEVDVAELEQAVKRAALVSERGVQVRLAFGAGTLTVSSGDDASSACETIPCTIAGDGIEIAFNPGYLLDGLATVDTDTVMVGMTLPSRPAVLAPEGSWSGEQIEDGKFAPVYGDHLYLIMPVRMPG